MHIIFSGMYHAGLGVQSVTSFFAALEIPFMHTRSMKEREREIRTLPAEA